VKLKPKTLKFAWPLKLTKAQAKRFDMFLCLCDYHFKRQAAMRGECEWPTVPSPPRSGALQAPTRTEP
jgi:hypothetical protein